jgi:branched-subunit amino acid ABC-type transport system permease component
MNVVQWVIDGIALGAVYALVAVGLALVFGVMRLINFAHGELITAGAYTRNTSIRSPVTRRVPLWTAHSQSRS